MNLCACDIEQGERAVGAGVTATMLSETGYENVKIKENSLDQKPKPRVLSLGI